jgi:hypothetical protein
MPECCKYYATLDYNLNVVTCDENGMILFSYRAEMDLMRDHYPNGPGTWPRCPVCGSQYPIDRPKADNKGFFADIKRLFFWWRKQK